MPAPFLNGGISSDQSETLQIFGVRKKKVIFNLRKYGLIFIILYLIYVIKEMVHGLASYGCAREVERALKNVRVGQGNRRKQP